MTKEPEPRSTGKSSTHPFPIEGQLKAFRAQLDGPPPRSPVVPELSKTQRKGIEALRELVERIRPVEILGMVRDVWSGGQMAGQFLPGGQTLKLDTLIYSYQKPIEEWKAVSPSRSYEGPLQNTTYRGGGSSVKTGKWVGRSVVIEQKVTVDFGNAKLPDEHSLNHAFHGEQLKRQLEEWQRADNLGIVVTVPYPASQDEALEFRGDHMHDTSHGNNHSHSRVLKPHIWFPKSTSQQEIMVYLAEKLEALRKIGQLPSQIAALELAKIEELRKRRLFIGPTRLT